ncbi:MAG: hypothetical protein A3F68_00300 [Acidobacteria bacterium RIFCSPLOWO2_12_FULL_54_10]|nr:MAG: hypothetical protein A3F68_00300 [Acidobacteria bacterium RIFCSPLOWO2_12_FULL_54_10]
MRVGIDTGGTFTDFVVIENSRFRVFKVFTDPGYPESAILKEISRLYESNNHKQLVIFHGTTVGTNTLLERRGAKVALLTTSGFEEVIDIGRQNRKNLYNLNLLKDAPLIPDDLRWGIRERVSSDGINCEKPQKAELKRIRKELAKSRAESVAVCLLFSFVNPANEQSVVKELQELGLPISISHEILPIYREYERLSTVLINAYLAPRVGKYLSNLEAGLNRTSKTKDSSPAEHKLYIMQSSGGVTSAKRASREPVRTILSGPAGGVVATRRLGDALQLERVISFDMGGTSADVSLFVGNPRTINDANLGGLPVAVPVLDVHSVGAGGGSIARLDEGGSLRAGPESAGALPGPACYGRGGTQPTVTDAHLLLGRIDEEQFLGGNYRLNKKNAQTAFEDFLRRRSARLKRMTAAIKTPIDLARGMLAVANATMEKALRVISVERGHDPRDFALVSFGGAGGLHAVDLARALGIRKVIVPENPGTFSAQGVLLADLVKDLSKSELMRVPREEINDRLPRFSRFRQMVNRGYEKLEIAGKAEMRADRFPSGRILAERKLDVRYVGQSYELEVAWSSEFSEEFHALHQRAFGYCDRERELEIVNLKLRLSISMSKPKIRKERLGKSTDAAPAFLNRKFVWFASRKHPTSLYDRSKLRPGMKIKGPAIVAEYSSTTVIPPGATCEVDGYRNLIINCYAH